MELRKCAFCEKPISKERKANAKFCDNNNKCKQSFHNRKAKEKQFEAIQEQQQQHIETNMTTEVERAKEIVSEIQKLGFQISKLESQIKSHGKSHFQAEINKLEKILQKHQIKLDSGGLEQKELDEIFTMGDGLNQQIALLEEQSEKAQKRLPELNKKLWALNYSLFRKLESHNDIMRPFFKSNGAMTIEEIETFDKLTTKYPFELIHNLNSNSTLPGLGLLKQPFVAFIFGEKEQGKTLLSVMFADDLSQYFKAKVLFCSDQTQWNNGLLNKMKKYAPKTKVLFKLIGRRDEIKNNLKNEAIEFLFLDLSNEIQLDGAFINQLHKDFPKLSIFLISKRRIASVEKHSDIIIEVREMAGVQRKGGSENYYFAIEKGADDWSIYEEIEEDNYLG